MKFDCCMRVCEREEIIDIIIKFIYTGMEVPLKCLFHARNCAGRVVIPLAEELEVRICCTSGV